MTSANRRFVVTWAALQLALLAGVAVIAFASRPAPPPGSVSIDSATLVGGRDDAHVGVSLPDDWRERAFTGRSARYRAELALDVRPDAPWAVLLPSVRMAANVRINGQWLGNLAEVEPPPARLWHRPLLFTVPAALLEAGTNVLEIDVAAMAPGQGYLDRPFAGPLALLAPTAARQTFWRQTLVQLLIAATVAVALSMLLLWRLRPHEPVYRLYGTGMIIWAGHNLNFVLEHPPLSARLWDAWAFASLGAFTFVAVFFIHRYLGYRRPRFERALLAYGAAGIATLVLLPEPAMRIFGELAWNTVLIGLGLYLSVCCHWEAWRRRAADIQLLAAASTPIVVFGLHATLITAGWLPWGQGYWLQFAPAGVLLAFTSLLIARFGRTLTAMEQLNAEMNERIAAARAEIEEQSRRVAGFERSQWLGAERERIARDVHDGVGGQLVSLLTRARVGKLTAADAGRSLSHALEDLRLVIDSLEVGEGDFATALAKFRFRIERRLRDTGIRLLWQPGECVTVTGFGPAEILQLLRLLDEACTNVIRHSRATEMTIRYTLCPGGIRIEVEDNGVGGATLNGSGYGLRNMRRRAEALNGTLDVRDGAGAGGRPGTTLELFLVRPTLAPGA